jgi:hypothetical protein
MFTIALISTAYLAFGLGVFYQDYRKKKYNVTFRNTDVKIKDSKKKGYVSLEIYVGDKFSIDEKGKRTEYTLNT